MILNKLKLIKIKNELIAFVVPTHMPGHGGWGNGYVAIPEGHPLFGKDYDDIDGVNVNGGLTFASDSHQYQPEETKGMWIVGFDTLHLGDDMIRWPDEASVMAEAQRLKEQLSEHPSPIKEQSTGAIEGLEDAAREAIKTKYAHLFINDRLINPDNLPSSPNCEVERFKEGAQWHNDTHTVPLLELCKELKEALELLYNSANYKSIGHPEIPFYVGISGIASGESVHKAKATIEKANNLLLNK